jgi:hypothetical protein
LGDPVPYPDGIAAAQHGPRGCQEGRHLPVELVGHPFVIGIEEGAIPAGRGRQAGIACRRRALVPLVPDQAQARLFPCQARHLLGCAVGTAIVDDQDLERAIGLRTDRRQGGEDRRFGIEGGDDDRNQWRRARLLGHRNIMAPGIQSLAVLC